MRQISETYYLAVDPGKRCGLAGFTETGELTYLNVVLKDQLLDTLSQLSSVRHFIVEEFRLFPDKALKLIYNDMVASRVIGMLECYMHYNGQTMTLQKATLKRMGFMYQGKKEPNHATPGHDAMVAHAHGIYYLVENQILDPATLVKK